MSAEFVEAVDAYRYRFDDSPPAYIFFELDDGEAIERMQNAVRNNQKLADLVPPDNTVI